METGIFLQMSAMLKKMAKRDNFFGNVWVRISYSEQRKPCIA